MQIQDALDLYVEQLQADGRSPHTIAQYRRHIRLLARWAADVGLCGDVSELTPQTLARFVNADVAQMRHDRRLVAAVMQTRVRPETAALGAEPEGRASKPSATGRTLRLRADSMAVGGARGGGQCELCGAPGANGLHVLRCGKLRGAWQTQAKVQEALCTAAAGAPDVERGAPEKATVE